MGLLKKIKKVQNEKYIYAYIVLMVEEKILPFIAIYTNLSFVRYYSTSDGFSKYKIISKNDNIKFNSTNVDSIKKLNKSVSFVRIENCNGILEVGKSKKKIIAKIEPKISSDSILIFMDRVVKADDNAEHLYRWWQKNHPEYNNIYYALAKDSRDFDRLSKEFKLLEYGSKEFKKKYIKADAIISSHSTWDVENYRASRYIKKRSNAKFFFLQHGMLDCDVSTYLSRLRLNVIFCSTKWELENIRKLYTFFDSEIALTGMSRNELRENYDCLNTILFAPTWHFDTAYLNKNEFEKSTYFEGIKVLITNKNLISLLRKNNITLKFILHPEMSRHINSFLPFINDVVCIEDPKDINYNFEFQKCKMLITDYSSLYNDVLWLEKPILFYQFTECHYERLTKYEDIGYVSNNVYEIVNEITNYLKNGNTRKIDQKYISFTDKRNSHRIFDVITNGGSNESS